MRGLRDLMGLKVVNGEGASLGDVRDVAIDQASGSLSELVTHGGGMLGLGGTSVTVPGSAIRGIEPDLVTLDMPAPSNTGQDLARSRVAGGNRQTRCAVRGGNGSSREFHR